MVVTFGVVCDSVVLVKDLYDCDRVLQWVLKGGVMDCIVYVFGPDVIVCHHRVSQFSIVLRD